ncbi:hypothetical protein HOE31_00120 [bacterium]|jgi:hypothetical protein|nr:hypothetical protein [bacterium]MBT4121346.1 hypothetical protein [bacterium]MBT4763853.1 hypothetical protein [bacterium]MBT5401223.1 hypothetical protein [bacterium]MBT6067224.1 hypothetical protein [bacterium]
MLLRISREIIVSLITILICTDFMLIQAHSEIEYNKSAGTLSIILFLLPITFFLIAKILKIDGTKIHFVSSINLKSPIIFYFMTQCFLSSIILILLSFIQSHIAWKIAGSILIIISAIILFIYILDYLDWAVDYSDPQKKEKAFKSCFFISLGLTTTSLSILTYIAIANEVGIINI